MKRRKQKRKPKQNPKPAEQVIIQGETEPPASPIEVQIEIESSANYVELQDEFENLASSVGTQSESENPSNPVVMSVDTEKPPSILPTPAAADRRSHPRYAFIAPVEVVAPDAGARIKTRVRDLSQQGCYVDTDTPLPLGTAADVYITKGAFSFTTLARVVSRHPGKGMGLMFTAVKPEQGETLDTWIAESRETSWLAANRRRSQRVLMQLPVRVSAQDGGASLFEVETHTLAISAHGALIALPAPVHRGWRLTLSNVQTKASLECVVAHIQRFQDEQIQVGVEFMLPNPTFWHVVFPPKDWTPRHPDAKSG